MIVARSSIMYCSKQVHQEVDLRLRPLPVLARQAVERELLDLEPGTLFGGAADRVDAAAMPGDARQILPRGPAAVAVHDDRDVPRPPFERECPAIGDVSCRWPSMAHDLLDDNRLSRSGPTETISIGRPTSSLIRVRYARALAGNSSHRAAGR